ncbi:MAG TPA: hypothetical protein ENJ44_00880 [Oceanospirillales bacterium]|nr:hypothetical protein [Oceanospirillales bacterium]
MRNLYKLNFSNNSVELLSQNNGNPFGIIGDKLSTSSNNEKVIFSAIDQIIPMLAGGVRFFSLNTNTNQIALVAQPTHSAITLNGDVITAKMSDDQTQIYFATNATNALANQTPTPITVSDPIGKLYHFNRLDGTTELVTASYSGNNLSSQDLDTLDVSPNGRFAVYNDTANGYLDLVLYDSQNNTYKEVGEGLKPKVNDDGNVVFYTYNGSSDIEVYLFDRLTENTQQVSLNTNGNQSDGASFNPDIAGAGLSTWIVFTSSSTDLIANDTNGAPDIFMVNWPNGNVFRISDTSVSGSTRPYISTNTTSVVYNPSGNSGDNLKKYDRIANTTIEVCNPNCDIDVEFYGISPSGRYVSYSSDRASSSKKLYLYDSLMDTTNLISVPMITNSPVFHSIGLDDSFAQPKLGVLYLHPNSLLDNLYGINNVAQGYSFGNGYFSAFLYQEGGDGETLNLNIQGTGQVTGGVNCQADCQFTYTLGTALTLSIIEPAGQTFVGWEGDCINQASPLDFDCDVIMDITKTITAKFIDNNDRIFIDGFDN